MIDFFFKGLDPENPIISWLVTLIVIGLLLAPAMVAWKISKHRFPHWKMTSIGVGFGFTAVPLSYWLFLQYGIGPIRALIFGFVGYILFSLHIAPLWILDIPFSLTATDTTSSVWLTYVIFGLIWGTIYGSVGLVIDLIRKIRIAIHQARNSEHQQFPF